MSKYNQELLKNLGLPEDKKKIVLAGNPNVGKSVFFNAFTGIYVDVSNYPGTTLDIAHGKFRDDIVVDTPGVYGISSFNDEEKIARDVILSADLVVNVVDAVHLERDLFLTQQIIDTGVPVIIALNMLDDAKKQGINIDVDRLSNLLGVPIIRCVATKNIGVEEVKNNLDKAKPGHVCHIEVQHLLDKYKNDIAHQGDRLLVLEGDKAVAERNKRAAGNYQEKIYLLRRQRVNDVIEQVITESKTGLDFKTKLSRWMIMPATGIPILLVVLYLMYKVIGYFVAQTVVDFTEGTIMGGYYEPFVRNLLSKVINLESSFGFLLAGEYGILTMTFTYVLGLLMPLVVSFYLFLSTFEDSGYLPRLAALTDRMLNAIGLNGRAIIPLILGFGCVTLATVVTRLLGSVRERRIAIFLLALAIPCSAQLGVIAGMLAGIGGIYILLYAVVLLSVLAIAGTVLNKILPGQSSELLIDLPPLRLPRVNNVMKKTFNKSFSFLKEALPLFAIGALLISIMDLTGFLVSVQKALMPLTVGWLNLPAESATAFVMGIVRRDFGAAGLTELSLDPLSTIIALLTITLFVPCIAAILVLFKERNKKEGALIWLSSLVISFLVGGFVNQLVRLFSNETMGIVFTMFTFVCLTILTGLFFKPKKTVPRTTPVSQEG